MTSKKPYPDILGTPISPQSLLEDDFDGRFRSDADERFDALFEYYDINRKAPTAWMDLAFALAKTHVPGFSVHVPKRQPKSLNPNERRGRPPELDMRILPLCVFTVLYRRRHNRTENHVSRIVGKDGHSLLPITSRGVRKIYQTNEFKVIASFVETIAMSIGDDRLLNDIIDHDQVHGSAVPWSEWKKILGTKIV